MTIVTAVSPAVPKESSPRESGAAKRGSLHLDMRCGMMRERVFAACLAANPDSPWETETPSSARGGRQTMLNPREALEVLDRDFLETRCKILEIAAVLDRIDRAPAHHHVHPDARMGQIRQALEALCVPGPGRSETIQLIFSLEYDRDWRKNLKVGQPARLPGKS